MDFLKRSKFDKIIEKSTSELLVEADLDGILTICDLIRCQEISPKYALQCIKRRLQNENPNVVLRALEVLESLMKNCGSPVHAEVCSTDFMQSFVQLTDVSVDVRAKVLECLQNWAYVFKKEPDYSPVVTSYEKLKVAGYVFPSFSESDAMFSVTTAPSWKEGNTCYRCKAAFTAFRRKHHCRHCGQIFCADCSSARAILSKFGIEKEVRVCDHCFENINRGQTNPVNENDKKSLQVNQDQRDKERKQRELEEQEAEELELALALSASEAEAKNRDNKFKSNERIQNPSSTVHLLPVLDTSEMDPELAQYLTRHYQRVHNGAQNNRYSDVNVVKKTERDNILESPITRPTAPNYSTIVSSNKLSSSITDNKTKTLVNEDNVTKNKVLMTETNPIPQEISNPGQEEFLDALRSSIEFFVNRLHSNNQRCRSISNDTTIQTLFLTLSDMHPQLIQYKQAMEKRRAQFERIQDKLTQLREAREALNALRQEHLARRRMEEQEAARLREIQMLQKLEIMRQQKRNTLEYKLRMALQQTNQYQQQYQLPYQQSVSEPIAPPSVSLGYTSMGAYMPNYNIPSHVGGTYHLSNPSAFTPSNMVVPQSFIPEQQINHQAQTLSGLQQQPHTLQINEPTAPHMLSTIPQFADYQNSRNASIFSMQTLETMLPCPTASETSDVYQHGHAYLTQDPSNHQTTPGSRPQPIPPESVQQTNSSQEVLAELPTAPPNETHVSEAQLISFD